MKSLKNKNIWKTIVVLVSVFVLFSFYSKIYAVTKPTVISFGKINVTETEMSVAINASWEDENGKDIPERKMWLLVQKYNLETKKVEGELKNIPLSASDFSNTGYTKFANIIVPNLTPEETYWVKFNLTEIPTGFFNSWNPLVLKTEPVYIKMGKLNQKNFTTATNKPIPIAPIKNDKNITYNNTYKLLAPIGNQKEIKTNDIGKYFNILFKLAIGLAAVLAVIMIIIGGIQWMGSESVFGKTEGQKRITSAILGLIIALGSYALLNTINPDLLGKKGLNVQSVKIEILTSNDSFTEGQKTNSCPEGIFTTQTENGNIPLCKSISENIKLLIKDANAENIKLFGFSYRSTKRQEELRTKNCGGSSNIYIKNAKCSPDTALPGVSLHESALAIDFTCNGKSFEKTGGKNSVCFKWLKDNAQKYGLINLESEPWHWSTTGH